MLKLEQAILEDFGLGDLSEEAKQAALHDIYKTLEMRVGMKLADQMTEEQAKTFEDLKNADDQEAFEKWLEATFPNVQEITAIELETLREEHQAMAKRVLDGTDSSDAQA